MKSDVFPLLTEEEDKLLIAYWAHNAEEWSNRPEATLRAIFESSQDGFVMISPDARVITFNRLANELVWKLSGKELYCGGNYTNHIKQDQISAFLDNFEKALGGEIIRSDESKKSPDGSTIWIHYTYNPVINEMGQVLGVCLSASDITEKREIEDTLRKNQELFKVLIEGLTDYAFYLLDNRGHINSWNTGAQRLLGYMESEIIGRDITCFFAHGDLEHSVPQFALVMAAKNSSYETEGWRVRKDGSKFWAQSVLSALHDPCGDLYGFVDIIRDITERKKQDERYYHSRSSTLDEF